MRRNGYKKRTQTVQNLIDKVNEHLDKYSVKYEGDSLFNFTCHLLFEKNMYRGYNFFKRLPDGKLVLAGSYDPNEFDCLQLF